MNNEVLRLFRAACAKLHHHGETPKSGIAFLVAPGLFATAGHCVMGENSKPHTQSTEEYSYPDPKHCHIEMSSDVVVVPEEVVVSARHDLALLRVQDHETAGMPTLAIAEGLPYDLMPLVSASVLAPRVLLPLEEGGDGCRLGDVIRSDSAAHELQVNGGVPEGYSGAPWIAVIDGKPCVLAMAVMGGRGITTSVLLSAAVINDLIYDAGGVLCHGHDCGIKGVQQVPVQRIAAAVAASYLGWKPDDDTKRIIESDELMVRTRLIDEIKGWAGSSGKPDEPVMMLSGGPGTGKTWVAASYLRQYPACGHHFCRFSDESSRNARTFVVGMLVQAMASYDPIAKKVTAKLLRDMHEANDEAKVWSIFCTEVLPLVETRELQEGEVHFVVDAIDEWIENHRSPILDALNTYFAGKFTTQAMSRLRVFMTCRPSVDQDVRDLLSQRRYAFRLDADGHATTKEVGEYVEAALGKAGIATRLQIAEISIRHLKEALIRRADGNFLVASFLLKYLNEEADGPGLEKAAQELLQGSERTGIAGLYHTWFEKRLFGHPYDEPPSGSGLMPYHKAKPVLAAIAASRAPVPESLLCVVADRDRDDLRIVLRRMRDFLPTRPFEGVKCVAVFHKSLIDWLIAAGDDAGPYNLSVDDGNKFLARACIDDWSHSKKGCSDYTIRHLAAHAVVVKDIPGLWGKARAILLGGDWIQAKLDRTGVYCLIADYPDDRNDASLWYLRRALELSCRALLAEPSQIGEQLGSRLRKAPQELKSLREELWSGRRGQPLRARRLELTTPTDASYVVLGGGRSPITSVGSTQGCPGDCRIITGHEDGTLLVHALVGSVEPVELLGHQEAIASILAVAGKDGPRLVTGDYSGKVLVHTLDGPENPVELRGHKGLISSMLVVEGKDGPRVVTGYRSGKVLVHPLGGSVEPVELLGHQEAIASILAVAGTDGPRVVTGDEDGKVLVHALGGSWKTVKLRGHESLIHSMLVAEGKDGPRVVILDISGKVLVHTLDGLENPVELRGHKGPISSMLVVEGKEGPRVATGDVAGEVLVHALDGSWKPVKLRGHHRWICWMLAVAGKNGRPRIVIRDISGKVLVHTLDGLENPVELRGHKGPISSMLVVEGKDGPRVVTVYRSGKVLVHPLGGSVEPVELLGHQEAIASILAVAGTDGPRVVTGDEDGKVLVHALGGSDPQVLCCLDAPIVFMDAVTQRNGDVLVAIADSNHCTHAFSMPY